MAAPLTSAVGGGGGVGGGGKGSGLGLGLEEDRGVGAIDRKSRVLHLEAALVRSEVSGRRRVGGGEGGGIQY